ncbi:MAG: hydantoinase B/oxoprolinase family protein, partial [Planctomycetaceae bacterium]
NNLFASIAEQIGITLRQTSFSTNVKERLDFSCAIFDPRGGLVVNAPHIPVHLGAMGETVRRILADNPDLAPGDVYVTNDPYRGGSHLPDVTVVTPVHDPRSGRLLFLTASRAHHAEIGGIVPGSMPTFSRTLADEGVLIRNFRLVERGVSREGELAALLASGPFPSRSVRDNLADVAAQAAANHGGVQQLLALVERYSLPVVEAYMDHIQQAAERKMRQALARLPDGVYRFTDHLDGGAPIAVAIEIRGDSAVVDFAGTGPVLRPPAGPPAAVDRGGWNLHANRAIVTAAVLYVFRCLINEDIPLNNGVLAPVTLVLPECLLNPPEYDDPQQCAAIVGGNVETSQRVVDVLLGALQLAAASQGTMNNLTFGDHTFGYYETICGGAGATRHAPGADAVHTHMTNTRLTDPEVIERRYPVRLREFS